MEVAYRLGGEATATETALRRRGKDLDPDMVDAYVEASKRRAFWSPPDAESVQQAVLDIRPRIPNEEVADAQVEIACQVMADFVDIKSPSDWGHSRATAEVAEGIARRLGLDEATVTRLRRAALVHDLGNVTVPCSALEKQTSFSADEWERLRLHPYYTDRILSRVGLFKDLAQEAVAHHERVDGGGYHRGLNKDHTTMSQRILALADIYVGLANRQTQDTDIESLLRQMEPLVGSQIDPECHQGLLGYLQGAPAIAEPDTQLDPSTRVQQPGTPSGTQIDSNFVGVRAHARVFPVASAPKAAPGARGAANLSQREIQVLQTLAKGLRNREVAQELVISEKTVERHLENIYNKLDITSRTSAVVYAVQNGLIK
ncbi:MAG TPA: HD domain-containing phosphohydrolase [Dehalococcoidia bacterium]|nr:HD domain-containing phosphohydrolase [Dehalococcoidia bacterium]